MTHDELLEKIRLKFFVNEEGATQSGFQESQLRDAVYAVVELEKVVPSFSIDKELYEMPIDTALQIAYANGFIDSREKVIQTIKQELA
jgi:hypothetical protein